MVGEYGNTDSPYLCEGNLMAIATPESYAEMWLRFPRHQLHLY